jgi:hypothetical protein
MMAQQAAHVVYPAPASLRKRKDTEYTIRYRSARESHARIPTCESVGTEWYSSSFKYIDASPLSLNQPDSRPHAGGCSVHVRAYISGSVPPMCTIAGPLGPPFVVAACGQTLSKAQHNTGVRCCVVLPKSGRTRHQTSAAKHAAAQEGGRRPMRSSS